MSHINEALKRAQKEKDSRHLKYGGLLAARGKKGRIPGRKALLGALFLLIILLLAFASYSWFDSRGQKATQTSAIRKSVSPAGRVKGAGTKEVQRRGRDKTKSPSRSRDAKAETSRVAALAKPKTKVRADSSTRPKSLQRKRETDAKILFEKAKQYHKLGRFQDARRLYQQALRLDPGYVDALNNLGVIYIHDQNYSAAQRSLEKAIRLKPGHVDPHYNLACLFAIKGEVKESLSHLKKAVSLNGAAKDWAKEDADLQNLRSVPEFEEIIE